MVIDPNSFGLVFLLTWNVQEEQNSQIELYFYKSSKKCFKCNQKIKMNGQKLPKEALGAWL